MPNSMAVAHLCHRPASGSQRDQFTSLGLRVLICALMGDSCRPRRQLWEFTPEPSGTPWSPSAELPAASRKHGLLHQSILANHLFCFLSSSLIGLPCALADGLGKRPWWCLGLPALGTKKPGCSGEEGYRKQETGAKEWRGAMTSQISAPAPTWGASQAPRHRDWGTAAPQAIQLNQDTLTLCVARWQRFFRSNRTKEVSSFQSGDPELTVMPLVRLQWL